MVAMSALLGAALLDASSVGAVAAPSARGSGAAPSVRGIVAVAGLPAGDPVVAVAAGLWHSLALTRSGRVFAWGDDRYGQLGNGTTRPSYRPVAVAGLSPDDPVIDISAGAFHSLAVTRSGAVYSWGANTNGQLGTGTTQPSPSAVRLVALPDRDSVVAVAGAGFHSLALTRSGRVYAWGDNRIGQDGSSAVGVISPTPVQIAGLPDRDPVVAVCGGFAHSLALTRSGRVYAWGDKNSGQLGSITNRAADVPGLALGLPPEDPVTALAGGSFFSLALTRSGRVYAWGDNNFGQLGVVGSGSFSSVPVVVSGLPHADPAVHLAGGLQHSLAVTRDGRVYAWGDGSHGQLDSTHDSAVALSVVGMPSGAFVVDVAAGGRHSLAVTRSGHVYAWGDNSYEQLGAG
jgi:alpha-tubulin suppressor-like RCC1 family protein